MRRKTIIKLVIIFFWVLIFFIVFIQPKIFLYKGAKLSGTDILSLKLWELKTPEYVVGIQNSSFISENKILGTELKPGYVTLFDGWGCKLKEVTQIKINSQGFRDSEYAIEKPENVYRIIVFGDSFTFGLGVENNETYPEQLEILLNRENEKKFEVLNFGFYGHTLIKEVAYLEAKALNYSPDLIIIGITLANDFKQTINTHNLIDCEKKETICRRRIEEPLQKFNEICSANNISVLMFFMVPYEEFGAMDRRIIQNLSNEYGFYYHHFEGFGEEDTIVNDDTYVFYPLDNHPGPLGHRLLAKSIYEYLFSSDILEEDLD